MSMLYRTIRIAVAVGWLGTAALWAQPGPSGGSGTAYLTDWPDDLRAAAGRFETDRQLLPKVDTLALEYRYARGERGADMSFVLSWRPGAEGLYEGVIRSYEALPPDVRMVAVELQADVVVASRSVADIVVAVDSMALAPHPSVYAFEVTDLAYDTVFLDTPADSAHAYFDAGFTLQDVRVRRIAFVSGAAHQEQRAQPPPRARRRPPTYSEPSVFVPDVHVVIGWRIGPRPYFVDRRDARRVRQPRGEDIGRTSGEGDEGRGGEGRRGEHTERGDESDEESETGRSSGRGNQGSRGRDDDDDDDDDSLLPAGAVALAGVGIAAIAGGTIGYHGTGNAPLGLMAGWVMPKGGTLLQASINSAVLTDDHPQHLVVKGVGFYDVFDAPVQPAVGIGAIATAIGDDTTVDPSLSLGLVGNFGRVVLHGGYDVIEQEAEFGIGINFRYKPDK